MSRIKPAKTASNLRPAAEIYDDLIRNPADITLSATQAAEIWKVFRRTTISPNRLKSLEERAFLQAALMSAIAGSEALWWVETLFRAAYTPNATIKGLISTFAQRLMSKYYKKTYSKNEELYVAIINTISASHRSFFDAILSDIPLSMLR